MADTTFVSKVTHVLASWLNPVNVAIYRAIGTGTNGVAPTTPADVRTNLGLTSTSATSGASLIGNNTGGGSLGANVQAALDLKANTSSLFTDPRHRFNAWDDAATVGNAQQYLEYTVTSNTSTGDRMGWAAVVNENSASNPDNFVALDGHALHLGTWNKVSGSFWGIATEAWSNADGYATLIGGELSVIQQSPTNANPNVGVNAVFKNRPDNQTHPTAPVVDGSLYNFDSSAFFSSSQARPSGGGAAWSGVGSGWQTVLRVGDLGLGSGLDWEGGDAYPQSSTYKAYSTIIDMTNALTDLAGGSPWFTLYRNAQTYWGMRFSGILTGGLSNHNLKINAGGAGYTIGDTGTIGGAGGNTAHYTVGDVSGGAVTDLYISISGSGIPVSGSGYAVAAGVATTATSGGGAGLTLDIALSTGSLYGAWLGPAVGGAGYAVGDLIALSGGGAAGHKSAIVEVTTVAAGVVTGIRLRSGGSFSLGFGYTVANIATTAITGVGAGLTVSVTQIWTELLIGGEKWEFWRMTNPSDPYGTGARHKYIDASFPGTGLTIDTSGATYTFPNDGPM